MGVGAVPGPPELSRGKKASVVAAPARKSTVTAIASGLPASTRRSRVNRPGNVVIGTDVAAPEMMKTPTMAASVSRHIGQYAFRMKTDA